VEKKRFGRGKPGRILDSDRLDFDFGKRLTVTVFLAVAFTAFLVENDHFVAFYMAQNAGLDVGATDQWSTNGNFTLILDEVYGIEGNRISFIRCQPVDEDLLTFLNFELLTGDGNNCEHIEYEYLVNETLFLKGRAKVRQDE